jgi:MFS family permease
MALLDSTIVTVSLPVITTWYSTDIETISWILNGYNLAFAVVLISASRIADQFGRKKYSSPVSFFSAHLRTCAQ